MKSITDAETVTNSEDKVRKSLHELQPSATDKKTLVGADRMVKSSQKVNETILKKNESIKTKKDVPKNHKKTTTDVADETTTEDKKEIEMKDLTKDLTCPNPDLLTVHYWRDVAEKRRVALKQALQENEKLSEKVGKLEAEKNIFEDMLNDARLLIEVLQEMMGGNNGNGINNSLEDSIL